MTCKYRVVVSIDGGGKKGLIPLRILSWLEEELNQLAPKSHLSSWVDVYSATSTGAIIAGALAISGSGGKVHYPSEIADLYLNRGHHFFDPPRSKQSVHPLNYLLDHFYGDLTLAHIKKHFLFVSYDLDRDEPYLFSDSLHHLQHVPVSKMMRACAASPGFLDSVMIGKKRLADGLLTTRNPSNLAYQYARVFYPEDPIVLISLGTGIHADDSLEDLLAEEQHNAMTQLAKKDNRLIYFRLNPEISEKEPSMQQLIADTDVYLRNNSQVTDRLLQLMEIKAGRLL